MSNYYYSFSNLHDVTLLRFGDLLREFTYVLMGVCKEYLVSYKENDF